MMEEEREEKYEGRKIMEEGRKRDDGENKDRR